MKNIFKKEVKNPLKNKKKSEPSSMACNHCSSKKVRCYAPQGIGTPCQRCTKAGRICEWPLTPEQDLATARKSRSCTTCKERKIRCNRAPRGSSGPCGNCALNGLSCSHLEVAQPTYAQQLVAGTSNQGMTVSPNYNALPYQIGNGATPGPATLLSIDTSMVVDDSGGSVTPSSGPSSPARSYWETVLNQEYAME